MPARVDATMQQSINLCCGIQNKINGNWTSGQSSACSELAAIHDMCLALWPKWNRKSQLEIGVSCCFCQEPVHEWTHHKSMSFCLTQNSLKTMRVWPECIVRMIVHCFDSVWKKTRKIQEIVTFQSDVQMLHSKMLSNCVTDDHLFLVREKFEIEITCMTHLSGVVQHRPPDLVFSITANTTHEQSCRHHKFWLLLWSMPKNRHVMCTLCDTFSPGAKSALSKCQTNEANPPPRKKIGGTTRESSHSLTERNDWMWGKEKQMGLGLGPDSCLSWRPLSCTLDWWRVQATCAPIAHHAHAKEQRVTESKQNIGIVSKASVQWHKRNKTTWCCEGHVSMQLK